MKLAALQKLTLLDYPGKVACTVFTVGCSLRCPFCHNSDLVLPDRRPARLEEEEFFSFLSKRRGILEGVCVTGGEPLLHADLPAFLRRIKDLGYAVKLDTNGCHPAALEAILREGLVDFVAMDVKNCPQRYAETVGIPNFDVSRVRRSLDLLIGGTVDYELRTTVAHPLHNEEDFAALGLWIKGAKRWALQEYRDSGDILSPGMSPCSRQEMERFRDLVRPWVEHAFIRGDQE